MKSSLATCSVWFLWRWKSAPTDCVAYWKKMFLLLSINSPYEHLKLMPKLRRPYHVLNQGFLIGMPQATCGPQRVILQPPSSWSRHHSSLCFLNVAHGVLTLPLPPPLRCLFPSWGCSTVAQMWNWGCPWLEGLRDIGTPCSVHQVMQEKLPTMLQEGDPWVAQCIHVWRDRCGMAQHIHTAEQGRGLA